MEDFTRKVSDFGVRAVAERIAEHANSSEKYPELAALRAGLNSASATLTGQGLVFDVPAGTDVFDHYEQTAAAVESFSDSAQSAASVTADIVSKVALSGDAGEQANIEPATSEGIVAQDIQLENSTGNNSVNMDVLGIEAANGSEVSETDKTAVTADMISKEPLADISSDGETAAQLSTGENPVIVSSSSEATDSADNYVISRAGMIPMEVQGGPTAVDPDVLKLALMTQDMNTFGATTAAETGKLEERQTEATDYFAG